MLSGGVDSSVSAYLLKKAGFKVVGVYFKRYKPDGDKSICKEDGLSAQKVAEELCIDFKVYDLEKEYKEKVFEYMLNSYKSGLTPNPDILCNREIKFGEFAKRAFKEGADYISSGHYVRLAFYIYILGLGFRVPRFLFNKLKFLNHKVLIQEGRDKNKDQSYFLSQVSPEILERSIFPLGKMKSKRDTRKIAERIKIHTAKRKDSQGICFIGKKIKLKDFLKKYIKLSPGFVYDLKGRKIGKHEGVELYTIGERRGFKLFPDFQSDNTPALYVIRKNLDDKSLVVGSKKDFERENAKIKFLKGDKLNTFKSIDLNKRYLLRIRHRGEKSYCKILELDNNSLLLELEEPVFAPSPGQFLALYDKDKLLLSAEIKELLPEI